MRQPRLVDICVFTILKIPTASNIIWEEANLNVSCPYIYVSAVSNIMCLITFPLNKETQYMQMHTCSNNFSSEYRNPIYVNV